MTLSAAAQQAAEQLARELGVTPAEAVERACNAALMLRWFCWCAAPQMPPGAPVQFLREIGGEGE